jgi:hypothetical protein
MTQQDPGWPPVPLPQPPPRPPSSSHLVASIIAGGILGMVAGAFAAVLLEMALTGGSNPGALVLLMFVLVPAGGLLGALWGIRRGRRPRRPPQPGEWRRRPNRIVDVRRRNRGEG